ncbi:MAG: DUF5317 domain-containing protein [Armatimonadota bacterium]
MLLDAVVPATVVGLLAGGRLSRFRDLDLRAPWVFVAAALVQVLLVVAGVRHWDRVAAVGGALVVASFTLLLLGLWVNRRLPGVWVAAIGVFLNLLVIAANGGAMPVDRELAVRAGNQGLVEMLDSPAYAKHKPVGPQTRLRPLADVLPLPMILPRPRWFSPGSVGDAFVTIGACWLILAAMGAFGLRANTPPGGSDPGAAKGQRQPPGEPTTKR